MIGPTIRVLHVDDDQDFADLTARFLELEGDHFAVQTAPNAAAGLDIIGDQSPDCIVSDYDMPGLNGIEFLRSVRDEWPDIPFILFTGKGSEKIASEAISAGVTGYKRKESGTEQYELLANRIETAVGQYRAEQELERKNDLFKKVQDLADIGAWEWDLTEQEGYYSDKVYDIYDIGDGADRSPQTDIEDFYHPEDQDRLLEAFETAIETGESYDIEVRVVTNDEANKWVRTSGVPQFEDGECVRIRGSIQDVTARKERERELESEREFIETGFNALDDTFYLVDTEGNFQRWNETLPQLTGYTDEEIGSMNALEFFEGEHRESIELAIHDILQTGSNVTEAEITTTDGRHIPHEFRGVRMTDDAGNPTGIIGIARDITTRKKRESELKAERDRLEEFASIISHDLRNPLTIAEGRLELAREECDSTHLDDIADAIDRSQVLIEDMLTLARGGDTVGSLEPVSLSALVNECWNLIPNDDATLTIDTTQTVLADRGRLRQSVENLLTNAVEHGGEDLAVSVGPLPNGFYIEDNGVGIPDGEDGAIFETGYSTAEDGTGFGLRIVEQIVAAHGWDIQASNSDAGGARFEITGVEFPD